MSKIVLRSLNLLLGLFFIFLGILKITPLLSRELHKDLRSEYAKYAKVFPLAKALEVKIPSKWYRRSVGATEIFAGVLLLLIPNRKLKNFGNFLLICTKLLNLYSHITINDQFERMAPSLVFFFMLICRLIVDWQFSKQQDVPVVSPEISGQFDELAAKPNQAKSSVHKTGSKQNGAKYSKKNQ